jgi:hypothetical protein
MHLCRRLFYRGRSRRKTFRYWGGGKVEHQVLDRIPESKPSKRVIAPAFLGTVFDIFGKQYNGSRQRIVARCAGRLLERSLENIFGSSRYAFVGAVFRSFLKGLSRRWLNPRCEGSRLPGEFAAGLATDSGSPCWLGHRRSLIMSSQNDPVVITTQDNSQPFN